MFPRILRTASIVVAMMAAAASAVVWSSTTAYAQCGCSQHAGGHAGHDAGSAEHQHGAAAEEHAAHDQPAAPHGGQLTIAPPLNFEVVCLPQEIRVYLYGTRWYPETTKDITGEVSLQRPYDERATCAVLGYIGQLAGQQDYLSAPVDLSEVKDGELTATVRLANLPLENRPGITFTQPVVVSKAGPQVALAALDESDQAGIARQRVCPVTGAALESMGDPIKVLISGTPLFLCCQGCLGKVQSDPEAYLRKVSQATQVQ